MAKEHLYETDLVWTGNTGTGTRNYKGYSRAHEISIEGKPTIVASSDPNFNGDAERYNPEEMLVASLSSCHMLWYLHLCSQAKIVVVDYKDKASGKMIETADGGGHFTEVILKPRVVISKESDAEKANELHHKAHDLCFIANSVKFPVRHAPEILIENLQPPPIKMQIKSKIEILTAANAKQFEQSRSLFREYADSLDVDLCFQSFDEELANLKTIYSPPDGSLLLAFYDKQIAGCVAVRKFESDVCEMKRLFVKPEFQGFGIGKNLIHAVIEKGRQLNYERMRLDTLPAMKKAQKLYASFGFGKIAAYRYNPDSETVFMELNLTPQPEKK